MRERERTVYKERELREHCGLAGIFVHPEDAPKINPAGLVLTMAENLVHRGQAGSGVLGVTSKGEIISHYRPGRDWEKIPVPEDKLGQLNQCRLLIAHNLYPTADSAAGLDVLQPFTDGKLIIAHNGGVVNWETLKQRISRFALSGVIDSDAARLHDLILNSPGLGGNRESVLYDSIGEQIIEGLWHAKGAFSLILGTADGALYAVRDPWGIRPLCFGKVSERSWAVASETVALKEIRAKDIQAIRPGHFLKFTKDGKSHLAWVYSEKGPLFCSFEGVYFGRPDSDYFIGNIRMKIAEARKYSGRIHARNDRERDWSPAETAVVPINRSGYWVSLGYAEESGFPFIDALPRSREVGQGRIFIQRTKEEREQMTRLKHQLLPELLQGFKRVVVGDDSIVRGDTTRVVVRMIREGAPWVEEVHLRIGSLPVRGGCYIGVATRDYELLAPRFNSDWEEIAETLGANSVRYLTLEELKESLVQGRKDLPRDEFCFSCFTREYIFDES